jgi:hypothetical protein
MTRQTIVAATVWLLLAGCRPVNESADHHVRKQPGTRPTNTLTATSPITAASASELETMIARQGSVTFRSFDGKWIGIDGDTDLTFMPNGALRMFEYGYGVSGYRGTYKIDSAGRVTVRLPTFGHAWPAMWLQKDATSLLLTPARDGNGFVMGNRGGATFVQGQGTYWPFRPLGTA